MFYEETSQNREDLSAARFIKVARRVYSITKLRIEITICAYSRLFRLPPGHTLLYISQSTPFLLHILASLDVQTPYNTTTLVSYGNSHAFALMYSNLPQILEMRSNYLVVSEALPPTRDQFDS